MVNAIACTIELWMHLGGLLSTQEARVALVYLFVRRLSFFRAEQPTAGIHNSIVHAMPFVNFAMLTSWQSNRRLNPSHV